MTPNPGAPPGLVWATRGRIWGFRFLLDAGLSDPLRAYEAAFFGMADDFDTCRQSGQHTALRFTDPELRRDTAGRLIPHEFVLLGPLSTEVSTVDRGKELVWPLVASAYSLVWDLEHAPTTEDLVFSAL
ncbi:MAG: hypothetical protein V9E81_05035 [Marmoricola sp.]